MAANYTSSNFIQTYQLTDKIVTVLDKFNNATFMLSVCQYERAFVKTTKLYISQEDRKLITLEFASSADALAALELLQDAMETLRPNCDLIPSPGSLPVINSITYAQYKAMQAANTLVSLQWYDVADLTSVFGLGPVLRLQAKTTDDFEPSGVVASSNIAIKINCLDDTIQFFEDSDKKFLATNKSQITDSDGNCLRISADNDSKIVATDSQDISVYNKSFLTLDTCTNIIAFNSTLNLVNSSNSKFFDINLDLSAITAGFQDITVDRTNTIGKKGAQAHNISLASQTLHSYRDLTNIIVNHDLLTQNQTVILDNEIIQANGQFEFEVISNGSPSAFSVTIKDTNNNTLFTITDIQIGFSILFRYNKNTDLFEFISQNVIDLTGLATLVDLDNLHDTINEEKVIDVTYAQLNNLVSTQALINGQYYRITDFRTYYTQLVTGLSLTGAIEPIIVRGIIEKVNPLVPATWIHKIGSQAFSEIEPKDIIIYDFYTGTRGTILYRKDTNKNLSAYYDFRTILFRRWQVGLEASGSYSNLTNNAGLSEDYLTFAANTSNNIELGKPLTQTYPNIIFRGTCSNIFLKDRDIDANYTSQTNIGWKEGIVLDNSTFNYGTWSADTTNGATRAAIASLYNALIATDKYIEVRLSELYERIINSQISEGSMYKIIDYVDQPTSLPSYVQYPDKVTDQEKLLVFGIKNNEIFNRAMSENFPNDDIGINIPVGSLSNIPNTQLIRAGLDGSTTVKNGITPSGNFTAYLNLINWAPEIWAAYRTGVMTEFGVIKDPTGTPVVTTIDFRDEVGDAPFTFQIGETYTFYFILSGVTRYSTTALNPGSVNPFTNYFVNLNPKINFRNDMSKNLFTWYDFRHLKFKRWEDSLGSGNFIMVTDPGNGEAFDFLLTFDNDINATDCDNIELGKPLTQAYPNIIFQGTNFNIFLKDSIIDQSYISQSALGWKEDSPYATTSTPGIIQLATSGEVITGSNATKAVTPATLVSAGYRRARLFTITGDNTTVDFVISHNVGNQNVVVQIFDNASPFYEIMVPIKRTSTNTITVSFDTAPTNLESFSVIIF